MLLQIGQRVMLKGERGIVVCGTAMSGLSYVGHYRRLVVMVILDRGGTEDVDVMVGSQLTNILVVDPYEVISREEALVHRANVVRDLGLEDRVGDWISYPAYVRESMSDYWRRNLAKVALAT